jgi:putative membrane-bound dehydrogenase-like protein
MIELVAAEPKSSARWRSLDADGKLSSWMIDYPNAETSGRIRLLEDRDGDGRYEVATVFADHLPFPNGVLPWRGGVLVTAAPDIWYLSDTNGDGRADERRVLLTGFGLGNQQLRVNGLTWGLDNWVYGANGRSEGEIRRPDDSPGKTISIRGHDFRFRPDTGELEAIAGRSQFGCATIGETDFFCGTPSRSGTRCCRSGISIAIRSSPRPNRSPTSSSPATPGVSSRSRRRRSRSTASQ